MALRRLMGQLYRDEAGGDGSGGGAAGSGGADGAGAGNGDGAAADAGKPSLLSRGADEAAAAAAADEAAGRKAAGDPSKIKQDPLGWLPEKFRVKRDGSEEIDIEASAKKGLGSLAELERRMRDTGLPPETPDLYEFKPPTGLEKLELDAEAAGKAKEGLHKLGLSQKQYQGVMEMYVGSLNDMVTRGTVMGAERAQEQLASTWGQPDSTKFKANLGFAFKAFNAFADEADKGAIDRVGNDPAMLRILAKVGRELQEDTSATVQVLAPESAEALMKDPAYFNPSHPRHAEVKAKVTAHYEALARAEERRAA